MVQKENDKRSRLPANESDKLKVLWDISHSLHQYINVDGLILHIIRLVKELIDAEGVAVMVAHSATDELVFTWADNEPPGVAGKLKEVRFPAKRGIAGSVFTSGKAELVPDVSEDPRHYQIVDQTTGLTTRSLISVPLKKKDRTVGILQAINKQKGHFVDTDLNFLETLAPIIAIALDNARMYTELDDAYKELQVTDRAKDDLIRDAQKENMRLRREIDKRYKFAHIVGKSDRLMEVFKLCEKLTESEITVLIEGETGTGKELIARTVHYNGPRHNRAFVTQNCGGIPDTLLASELFGHKKGAYTGAFSDKQGLFEFASGGTLFLDEVAEMSAAMQTSLLRVLQEGEVKPLGSNRTKKVDVRVISATNKNLSDEVKQGRFREDLFYRLSVFTIDMPPLRDRDGDIPLLAKHFVSDLAKKTRRRTKGLRLSREAIHCLSAYPFPGNVRELENEIERAVAMAADEELIRVDHLSEKIQCRPTSGNLALGLEGSLKDRIEALEISILTACLKKHEGNKTRVAKELGLSRNGLMKKMQRYEL
jgi:transcriptional regulator with GAF, ATPase, and Fis domain